MCNSPSRKQKTVIKVNKKGSRNNVLTARASDDEVMRPVTVLPSIQ